MARKEKRIRHPTKMVGQSKNTLQKYSHTEKHAIAKEAPPRTQTT